MQQCTAVMRKEAGTYKLHMSPSSAVRYSCGGPGFYFCSLHNVMDSDAKFGNRTLIYTVVRTGL